MSSALSLKLKVRREAELFSAVEDIDFLGVAGGEAVVVLEVADELVPGDELLRLPDDLVVDVGLLGDLLEETVQVHVAVDLGHVDGRLVEQLDDADVLAEGGDELLPREDEVLVHVQFVEDLLHREDVVLGEHAGGV